jgi:tripartite-type tricarboxylate transporter receptor subunit TctC
MPPIRTMTILATLMAASTSAPAQTYPNRPITIVVPFLAGGATDVIARLVAEGLREQLGQPVIIENVGGAGGMVGTSRVAKAPPDGYQLVLGNVGTHAHNQSMYKKPLYNAATDFAPVALIADQSLVLTVRKDLPVSTMREFIAYTKANQGKMQYGSSGTGGSNHLGCVLLNSAMSVNVTHVPYRSGAQAMQDLIAGRVDYECPSGPVVLPQIEAKTVKALAVLSRDRSPALPDLPSANEQGLTDFDVPTWYALFVPKGTPTDIVQKLNRATVATLQSPNAQQRMKQIGSGLVEPARMTPEYLGKFVAAEIDRWAVVIKASEISLE